MAHFGLVLQAHASMFLEILHRFNPSLNPNHNHNPTSNPNTLIYTDAWASRNLQHVISCKTCFVWFHDLCTCEGRKTCHISWPMCSKRPFPWEKARFARMGHEIWQVKPGKTCFLLPRSPGCNLAPLTHWGEILRT